MRTLTSSFNGGECRNPSLGLTTKARGLQGYSSFIKCAHGGQVKWFVAINVFLLFQLPYATFGIHEACQDHGNKRAEDFVKCENSMDKHVRAFEMGDYKIQNINYENVKG